jgi:hypothetical protein
MSPSTAHLSAQSEFTSIPDEYEEDLVVGDGRVAQPTRRMTVRFEVFTEDGRAIGQGEAQFLFPPLKAFTDSRQPIQTKYDSGTVPGWVGSSIMGMRVGGTRRISLKAAPSRPRHYHRNSRGVYVEEGAEDSIGDARTHQAAVRIPRDASGYLVATLLEVWRPHFKIWQTPRIIDVGTDHWLRVGSCE